MCSRVSGSSTEPLKNIVAKKIQDAGLYRLIKSVAVILNAFGESIIHLLSKKRRLALKSLAAGLGKKNVKRKHSVCGFKGKSNPSLNVRKSIALYLMLRYVWKNHIGLSAPGQILITVRIV